MAVRKSERGLQLLHPTTSHVEERSSSSSRFFGMHKKKNSSGSALAFVSPVALVHGQRLESRGKDGTTNSKRCGHIVYTVALRRSQVIPHQVQTSTRGGRFSERERSVKRGGGRYMRDEKKGSVNTKRQQASAFTP